MMAAIWQGLRPFIQGAYIWFHLCSTVLCKAGWLRFGNAHCSRCTEYADGSSQIEQKEESGLALKPSRVGLSYL